MIFKLCDITARRYKWDDCDYVGIPGWEGRVIWDKKFFEDTVYLDFEDFKVPAPSGYDTLLKEFYGDYMKRPPENERQPHHNYKAYKI